MTSSLHSGERRWASSRKSGMTVLGKVAVPKPINLPSQRLENHGLDPNVEIVPKGTLSWGSKSSSFTNAWGSSTLSPNTDGSSGSPSHLSARPSSGGSGTRPSTAASDRAQEPPNARGSNSRPSTASGSITSNQAPFASLRPRSAEARPGSSQLSRFAEPASESPGAWGAAGIAERLGISSSKNDGFSLASSDFPTLGSEKETTGKTTARQDHRSLSRPGSSSGEVATVKEKIGEVSASTHLRSGNADSWRRDNPTCSEDGISPSMERWHADPQGPHPFPNSSIPLQHYGGWHGPPINNHPGSGWYRGPPGNLPYGSPVPPGGFPLDPIHFYQPQIPGPQPVPPPGVGPRGNYSNKGDMFQPPMTDAYVHPGMPMRPGFYPTPVPYEGYYGPPIGYCNSNERDTQFIGMPAGPAAYNRFHGPNAPDMGSSHSRVGRYGPSGKALASEHVESGHPHDTRGPFKVLLKQHDDRESNKQQKWGDFVPTSVDKDDQHMPALLENEWKAGHKNEELNLRRTVVEEAPHSIDRCRGGSVSMNVLPKGVENSNAFDRMRGSVITNSGSNEASRSQDSIAASGAVNPRRSSHGLHGRTDHGDKGRFNSQETDLRWKKPAVMDSLHAKPAEDLENSDSNAQHHSSGAAEISEHPQAWEPTYDPSDSQHAMMELAKQRMKQRQEEEEERARDQKARALAKLEELNRRRQAVESSAQKLVAESVSANKQEESHFLQEGSKPPGEHEVSDSAVVSKSNVVSLVGNSIIKDEESTVLSVEQPPESTTNSNKETSEKDAQSLSLRMGANKAHPPHRNKPQLVADCSPPEQKHVRYRQKQNVPLEKISTEKSVSDSITEVYFGQINTAVNLSSAKAVATEAVSNTDLNSARSIMNGPLTPQRRKNGRNDRNKQKVDEASSMASLPSGTSCETNIANNLVEDGKAKSSDSDCDPLLAHPQNDSKETNQTLENHSSSPNEEFHGRVNNNQRKPQQSRWAARNPQAQKPAEKFYCNDAVFWAPVKSHSRNEVAEQVNQKTNVEAGDSSVKSNPQLQNIQRNKRAEMERYVVKPVFKDIAQHGSGQQRVSTSDNQPSVRGTDYGAQGAETTTDLRSGDGKHNRQGKGRGSSRQHTSTEQTTQSMPDSQSLNSNKKKSTGHLEDQKIDSNLVKEQPEYDEGSFDDGWVMPEPPDSALPPYVPVARDQGVATRAKRHAVKGHRGWGNNHVSDHRKTTRGETEKHQTSEFPVSDASLTDYPSTSKENHGVGDRPSSHWQPKSSSPQQGNRPDIVQNVGAENGRGERKDSSFLDRTPQPRKQTSEGTQDSSASQKRNVGETMEIRHQDNRRERQAGPVKECPRSANRDADVSTDPPLETRTEQRMPGPRRNNGNQTHHLGRGQESHGDWGSSGHQHKFPPKEDRQRHNSHYEYKPVGPQSNNRANNPEGPKDASHYTDTRSKERGQSQSRRGGGNFHG